MSVSPHVPMRKPRRWLLVIAAAALLVGVLPALVLAQVCTSMSTLSSDSARLS